MHHRWTGHPRLGKGCNVASHSAFERKVTLFTKALTTLEKERGTAPCWGTLKA